MIVQIEQDETGKVLSIGFIAGGTGEDLRGKAKAWLKAKYPKLTVDQLLTLITAMDDHQIRIQAP